VATSDRSNTGVTSDSHDMPRRPHNACTVSTSSQSTAVCCKYYTLLQQTRGVHTGNPTDSMGMHINVAANSTAGPTD